MTTITSNDNSSATGVNIDSSPKKQQRETANISIEKVVKKYM